jgi:hypothetical protein
MSAREETLRQSCGLEGKGIRGGRQPRPGGPTRSGSTGERLTTEVIARLRGAGPRWPRAPYPGQRWTPATATEELLAGEVSRWHRTCQMLLGELGRARPEPARPAVRGRVRVPEGCPLSDAELRALTAAATGEPLEATARRLLVSTTHLKHARQGAVSRLRARSTTHAVALCVVSGWIAPEALAGGDLR